MSSRSFLSYFFLLLLLPFATWSQGSYLSFEEVVFELDIERRLLHSILEAEGDPIDGFLAFAYEDSASFEKWKAFYNRELALLKERKIPKKKERDIKNIYDQLHEKFLRKYHYLAYFDEIFESGVYNCVTAVALYAMSFEELGIPYTIKETPTHVYIVADPSASQVLIETTDPIGGFKSFSPGFKENYVTQLALRKMVDQSDIATKGLYPIFDEFYFGGADLTLKQLIGIQYYNKGIDLYDQRDYQAAWDVVAKGQLFHSSDQLDELLFSTLVNTISGSDYSDWKDISLLPYLARFQSFDIKKTDITGEFARMLQFVLFERNDSELAESAFQNFVDRCDDQELNSEITYIYHYEVGRKHYNRGNYSDAFNAITEAYTVKPGSANAESLLTESFRLAFRNKPVGEALAAIETLMSTNEELTTNHHFNSMRLNLYLSQMAEDFEARRPTNGNKMKTLFESAVADNEDYIYDNYILAAAYSQAAVYYFKRGYTSKARTIIQKGLQYAPDSYELKSRLRMISR